MGELAGTVYKAVFFDAGGTLLQVKPSMGEVYCREAARFGLSLDPESLARAFAEVWRARLDAAGLDSPFYASDESERAWWRDLVWDVLEIARKGTPTTGQFEGYFDHLFALFARPDVWHVYEDVKPALDVLRAMGIRCAVVSNWDSRLPRLLESLGLYSRLEFVLTSAEAGRRKPDPLIFHQAVSRTGLAAAEILYVGDSVEDDVAGARGAGLMPVLIDRTGRLKEDVLIVTDLRDLAHLVKGRQ